MTDRETPAPTPSSWRSRLLRCSVPTFCLLFLGWEGIKILPHPERGDWATCYLKAARRMALGQPIHRPGEVFAYTYPPLMAWLVTPLADWRPGQAQWAFWFVNAAATAVAFLCAWRLIAAPPLAQLSPRWQAVFWCTAALTVRFVAAPISHRQFDVIIAAALLAGVWWAWRGRSLLAGVSLGLAAGMKCTPLLLIPYFAWRRQYLVAAVATLICVAANVLPDLTHPQANGRSYVADWRQHALGHTAREAPGQWFADLRHNQSLAGGVNRWWRMVRRGSLQSDVLVEKIAPQDHAAVRALAYGLCLLTLAVGGWPILRAGRGGPLATDQATRPADRGDPLDYALEIGAVLCLMLLVSPMTSKAHLVVLLLPLMALARWTIVDGQRRGYALLGALFLLGFCTSRDLVGLAATDAMHMLGVPTAVVLTALWGCCHAITVRQERAAQGCQSRDVEFSSAPFSTDFRSRAA